MREQFIDSQIPTPEQSIPTPDHRTIARGMGARLTESFLAEVTGAGGVGATILHVPFKPAVIDMMNAAGATPATACSIFPGGPSSGTARHTLTTTAVATNANPPVVTRVGANDYTVQLPTQLAPNGEVVLVEIRGCRDTGGSA